MSGGRDPSGGRKQAWCSSCRGMRRKKPLRRRQKRDAQEDTEHPGAGYVELVEAIHPRPGRRAERGHPHGDRRLMKGLQGPVRSDGETGAPGKLCAPGRSRRRSGRRNRGLPFGVGRSVHLLTAKPGPRHLGGIGAGRGKAARRRAGVWAVLDPICGSSEARAVSVSDRKSKRCPN